MKGAYVYTENGWTLLGTSQTDTINPPPSEGEWRSGTRIPNMKAVYNFVKQEIENIEIPTTPSYEIGEGLKLEANVLSVIPTEQAIPLYGRIDNENNITLLGNLAPGTYSLRYEGATGYKEIGVLSVNAEDVDNMLAAAVAPYDLSEIFDGRGFMNKVYASTASPYYGIDLETFCTGLMTVPEGKEIYIKGADFDTSNSHTRLGIFKEDGSYLSTQVFTSMESYATLEKLGDLYYKLTFTDKSAGHLFCFSTLGEGDYVVITNHPIGE